MISRLARGARILILGLVLGFVALAVLLLETEPSVRAAGPPDAAAAAQAREVASSLKALIEEGSERWSVSEAALNGALASAGRVVPGLAGWGEIGTEEAWVALSLPVPKLPWDLWLNLRLALGVSEEGLRVVQARVGRLPLPPGLVVPAVRAVLDLALGDGLGTAAVAGIEAVRMDGERVEVALGFDRADRVALYESVRDRLRALSGGTDREVVYAYLDTYPYAMERGEVSREGSVLPYLRYTIGLAAEMEGEPAEVMQAALYALALYCGDERFGVAIGVSLSDRLSGGRNRCRRTTLDGREDLRQHFMLSAGLYAASTGGATFGVGELKELLDSNAGGSGFSFDDIAADLAGARFAEAFLSRPREEWPQMLAGIMSERDVLPAIEDLPSGLSEAEFRTHYGSVEDPRYKALLAEIEGRIEAMPLYRAARIN